MVLELRTLIYPWIEVLDKRRNEEAHWDDGLDLSGALKAHVEINWVIHLKCVYFSVKLYLNKRVKQNEGPEKEEDIANEWQDQA